MEKFYLTFGTKYPTVTHPHWPDATSKGWVLIEANDEAEARHLAMSAFGPYWSMLYEARRFNEAQNKRHYYPLGKIGYITTDENTVNDPWTIDLKFTASDPRYYGEEPDGHLGNRVEGRLLPECDPNLEFYDVEYFHDRCLPEGYGMFEKITETDAHVLNFEMDWANPWTCAVCGEPLNK